ncbi:hypothetical protein [Leyella stercorea]|nr:hypothetical protein [Leyella stercorea]
MFYLQQQSSLRGVCPTHTDRCRCLHRPTQMSAPTDADVRTDRRGCSQ